MELDLSDLIFGNGCFSSFFPSRETKKKGRAISTRVQYGELDSLLGVLVLLIFECGIRRSWLCSVKVSMMAALAVAGTTAEKVALDLCGAWADKLSTNASCFSLARLSSCR